jgi:hypothetical protein
MDASRLTRLRREQASQWLSTRKTLDASDKTREVKLVNSKVIKQVEGNNTYEKTVLSGGGSIVTKGGSYETVLLKDAGNVECCFEKNNMKGDKVKLAVDCYTAEPNPVKTTKCTPCFVGTRLQPGEKKTAPDCC